MARTKKISKGSRASTSKWSPSKLSNSKHSMAKRSTSKLSTSNLSTSIISVKAISAVDGFAVPAPVLQSADLVQKDLEHQFNAMMADFDATCKAQLSSIKLLFSRKRAIVQSILKKPITELFADYQPPPPTNNASVFPQSLMRDRTDNEDMKMKIWKDVQSDNVVKKLGITRTGFKLLNQQKTASANTLITPSNIGPMPSIPVVTPKVSADTPLSILRRPRAGESAISMDGSPLMVSTIPHDKAPSVTVPMPDGTILSILPRTGITSEQLPRLNAQLRAQLQTLQSNVDIILREKNQE